MRRKSSHSSISTTMTTTRTVTTTSTAGGFTTTNKEESFLDEYNFDTNDDDNDNDDDDVTIVGSNCKDILKQRPHLRMTGQRHLARYHRRGRADNNINNNTKFRVRLRRYLSSIGGERINTNILPFGDKLLSMDASGRCNYRSKDGKFDIQISQDSKKNLSISTCVYSCRMKNIASSMSVMKCSN